MSGPKKSDLVNLNCGSSSVIRKLLLVWCGYLHTW